MYHFQGRTRTVVRHDQSLGQLYLLVRKYVDRVIVALNNQISLNVQILTYRNVISHQNTRIERRVLRNKQMSKIGIGVHGQTLRDEHVASNMYIVAYGQFLVEEQILSQEDVVLNRQLTAD